MTNQDLARELYKISAAAGDACEQHCRDPYMVRQQIFIACCQAAEVAYNDAASYTADVREATDAA